MPQTRYSLVFSKMKTAIEEEITAKSLEFTEKLSRYALKYSEPPILSESMNYSLFADAKRIRPVLFTETVRMFGGDESEALPLAAGLEMIHTYSLIHDDLPCMDDDDLRRGKASNHIVFGYPVALLAGDALLNSAYETMISGYFRTARKTKYMRAFAEIAGAAGVLGMIGGQCADIIYENKDPNKDILEFIHKNKTGAMIKASVYAGALFSGARKEELELISTYGECIGFMFQIVDDILDITGDTETMGKKTSSDEKLSKMTYPYVHGLENAYRETEYLNEKAVQAMLPFKEKGEFFINLADYLAARMR